MKPSDKVIKNIPLTTCTTLYVLFISCGFSQETKDELLFIHEWMQGITKESLKYEVLQAQSPFLHEQQTPLCLETERLLEFGISDSDFSDYSPEKNPITFCPNRNDINDELQILSFLKKRLLECLEKIRLGLSEATDALLAAQEFQCANEEEIFKKYIDHAEKQQTYLHFLLQEREKRKSELHEKRKQSSKLSEN